LRTRLASKRESDFLDLSAKLIDNAGVEADRSALANRGLVQNALDVLEQNHRGVEWSASPDGAACSCGKAPAWSRESEACEAESVAGKSGGGLAGRGAVIPGVGGSCVDGRFVVCAVAKMTVAKMYASATGIVRRISDILMWSSSNSG